MWRRAASVGALIIAAGVTVGAPPALAERSPDFQVPFTCGETWRASTYAGHKPENAVDWNFYPKPRERGKPVRASLAGRVTVSQYNTQNGYGHNVEIDHGNGWRTFYAHLASRSVSVGDRVTTGQVLGIIGNSSETRRIETHLHYEQRHRGDVVKAVINSDPVRYPAKEDYTSANACSGKPRAVGTVDTAGAPLTVRTGPGTGYEARGSVADGTRVTILCQTNGTLVTGTYGPSRLWNKIGDGRFVSDAYVLTGSDERVAPAC